MLTDTHTHLYSDAFDEDREAMMKRALDHRDRKIFYTSHRFQVYRSNVRFRAEISRTNVYLMMGLHPTSVKDNYEKELQHVELQFAAT